MMTAIVMFVIGVLLLVGGSEALVRGASNLALRLGVAPLVIGLTIVAFGTSAPEMAVSVAAAWNGQPDLVMGNAVGSNIFNILFILGVSALIVPLVVHQQLIRVDVPIMIGTSLLAGALCIDGNLSRLDGAVLLAGLGGYTWLAIAMSRREAANVKKEYEAMVPGEAAPAAPSRMVVHVTLLVVGLVLCVVGARLMVTGAVSMARAVGLSELVIGLTIVAAGTSLPEVATSIVAAMRGQRDIAVGNVVGSNIFNILGILGVTGLISPAVLPVPEAALYFDFPVMLAATVACLPVFFTARCIARWEGAVFLGFYVAYVVYLVLASQQHDAAGPLGHVMLWYAIPLAALGLGVSAWSSLRGKVKSQGADTG